MANTIGFSNTQLNKEPVGDVGRGTMIALTGKINYDGVDHSSTYEADMKAVREHLDVTERIRECRDECNLADFV